MIRIDGLYTRSIADPSLYIIIGDKAYMTSVQEYRELNMKDLEPCGFPVNAIKKFSPMPKYEWRFRGLIEREQAYYVANEECMDSFYGDQHPVCVPESTLLRLASSWGIDIADMMEQVHEASQREIETYGIEDA